MQTYKISYNKLSSGQRRAVAVPTNHKAQLARAEIASLTRQIDLYSDIPRLAGTVALMENKISDLQEQIDTVEA